MEGRGKGGRDGGSLHATQTTWLAKVAGQQNGPEPESQHSGDEVYIAEVHGD